MSVENGITPPVHYHFTFCAISTPNRKKMKKKKTYLREKRDKRVFERYLYWTEQQRLRFDDTIRRLSEQEFFLTEDYILAIIKKEKAKNEAEGLDIPRHRYLSVAL